MPTILVVEDDDLVRRMVIRALHQAKFEALEAADGDAALLLLQDHKPDLILLDIVMPRVNGLEFLRQIRNREALKNIPVIISTSANEVEILNTALSYGAQGYLLKSDIGPEMLVDEVNKYLPKPI